MTMRACMRVRMYVCLHECVCVYEYRRKETQKLLLSSKRSEK